MCANIATGFPHTSSCFICRITLVFCRSVLRGHCFSFTGWFGNPIDFCRCTGADLAPAVSTPVHALFIINRTTAPCRTLYIRCDVGSGYCTTCERSQIRPHNDAALVVWCSLLSTPLLAGAGWP